MTDESFHFISKQNEMAFRNSGEKKVDYWIFRIETMARRMEKEVEITRKKAEEFEHRANIQQKMVDDMRVIQEKLLESKEDFASNLQSEAWTIVDKEKRELGVSHRKLLKEHKQNLEELELLREKNNQRLSVISDSSQVAIVRAKTFAIMDSILFAIENWSCDDSPAPDITLASQATLFPVMLQKVSSGDENYYLDEVPHSAIEVVRRGRELVQQFREQEHISVLDPTGWSVLQPILHEWWTRDGLPLLFGQGYEGWEFEEPFTRDQMLVWKNMEMSRAMDFPLIFDGFELVKKYGDEIREETGLPDFSRQVMQTRIKVND